jgi:hypothetical protein
MGNLIVLAEGRAASGSIDGILMAFDATGKVLWTKQGDMEEPFVMDPLRSHPGPQ